MKRAEVYLRREVLIFAPQSRTTAGVWIVGRPCVTVSGEAPAHEKAAAISTVLDASTDSVSHPTSWTGVLQPLLDAAGVKNWKTFVRSAKSVGVECDGDSIVFVPYANLGAASGFQRMPADAIRVSRSAPPDEVEACLTASLRRAQ